MGKGGGWVQQLRHDTSKNEISAAERWCLRLSTPRRTASDAAAGVITPPLLECSRRVLAPLPVSSHCWKTCQHCYSGVAHPLLMYTYSSPPDPPICRTFIKGHLINSRLDEGVSRLWLLHVSPHPPHPPPHFNTSFLFFLGEAVCRFHGNYPQPSPQHSSPLFTLKASSRGTSHFFTDGVKFCSTNCPNGIFSR